MTTAYDLEINWKGDTKGASVTPDDGVDFTTESEEADIHTTGGMKLTQAGKPVIFHIFGKSHCFNRCPYREESAPENKADKADETPKKKIFPTKASVNVTIGEDWDNDTGYGGLMFCQVTAGTAVDKNLRLEYQHTLSQSGGHTSPTWVLLDNQSTVDVFFQ